MLASILGYKAVILSMLLTDEKSPHFGDNNNKKVDSVKKADKPSAVININVYGDNKQGFHSFGR